MGDRVKIVECPRDAWQGLPKVMPAEVKADYLRALVAAGFRHIDAVSFAAGIAVTGTMAPEMGETELVLEYLDAPEFDASDSSGVEILAMVANKEGAERAVATGRVQALAFPYSVSETFLKRNGQTALETVEALEEVGGIAHRAELELVGYLSMAWGNPFRDAWSMEEVVEACDLLVESGAGVISLVDTAGLAKPKEIGALVDVVMRAMEGAAEVGVHLRATPEDAPTKVQAAWEAGCRRFDSVIGGMGASPFAQDAMVGNLATEMLLRELGSLGAEVPEVEPKALEVLARASAEIARKYGARVQ